MYCGNTSSSSLLPVCDAWLERAVNCVGGIFEGRTCPLFELLRVCFFGDGDIRFTDWLLAGSTFLLFDAGGVSGSDRALSDTGEDDLLEPRSGGANMASSDSSSLTLFSSVDLHR